MAASRRPRTAAWDRRRRGWPRGRWRVLAPRSAPGNGVRSLPTASVVFSLIVACAVECAAARGSAARGSAARGSAARGSAGTCARACAKRRVLAAAVAIEIQVHALAHVPGEADGLAHPVAFPGRRALEALGASPEALPSLLPPRGTPPVADDAARGPDDEPKAPADHRRAPVRGLGALAAGGSSPFTIAPPFTMASPFTMALGSAPDRDAVPRRSLTACRTP